MTALGSWIVQWSGLHTLHLSWTARAAWRPMAMCPETQRPPQPRLLATAAGATGRNAIRGATGGHALQPVFRVSIDHLHVRVDSNLLKRCWGHPIPTPLPAIPASVPCSHGTMGIVIAPCILD